jgi:hypothetical protein
MKDDFIHSGINKFQFDIMGMAETNVNWNNVPEEDKLYNRSRHWCESCNLVLAHNGYSVDRRPHQFGGVAMWSLGKAVRHIVKKGLDSSGQGRWVWIQYKGRLNTTIRVITAYSRPATPLGGPLPYTQQCTVLLGQELPL